MPWHEMSPMEQRLEFVREFESELFTMTELAAQYGVSRKTGYKWLARSEVAGALGLQDRSRRPQASPHATDPELLALLIRVRQRHPRWGARKLLVVAARQAPKAAWPCPSTVSAHLKIWTVSFATVVLGRFDERQHCIHPITPVTAGRSASSAGSAPARKNERR